MKRLKPLLYLALAISVLFVGCATDGSDTQSITQLDIWEDTVISEEQLDFYDDVSVSIEKIDSQNNTAIVTVTIPGLEQYLQNADAAKDSIQTVELEFPVQQVNGEWQIASMAPLIEYIRNESTRILIEMMESNGGVTIDFDPQEVTE